MEELRNVLAEIVNAVEHGQEMPALQALQGFAICVLMDQKYADKIVSPELD